MEKENLQVYARPECEVISIEFEGAILLTSGFDDPYTSNSALSRPIVGAGDAW